MKSLFDQGGGFIEKNWNGKTHRFAWQNCSAFRNAKGTQYKKEEQLLEIFIEDQTIMLKNMMQIRAAY